MPSRRQTSAEPSAGAPRADELRHFEQDQERAARRRHPDGLGKHYLVGSDPGQPFLPNPVSVHDRRQRSG